MGKGTRPRKCMANKTKLLSMASSNRSGIPYHRFSKTFRLNCFHSSGSHGKYLFSKFYASHQYSGRYRRSSIFYPLESKKISFLFLHFSVSRQSKKNYSTWKIYNRLYLNNFVKILTSLCKINQYQF